METRTFFTELSVPTTPNSYTEVITRTSVIEKALDSVTAEYETTFPVTVYQTYETNIRAVDTKNPSAIVALSVEDGSEATLIPSTISSEDPAESTLRSKNEIQPTVGPTSSTGVRATNF